MSHSACDAQPGAVRPSSTWPVAPRVTSATDFTVTMPHERLRAIGWGDELLQTIQHDLSIPEHLRADAQAIAAAYPSASELLNLTGSGVQEFPAAGADAIERARVLFETLQVGQMGSDDVKRDCLYTLRHFPRSGWGKIATNAARLGKLDEWLASEDPAH